jgi:hypothetical protein
MNIRYSLMILVLALLLLANCASATQCVVFVADENHQTINNAKIYIDDWSNIIGITTYNAGIGRNCWVGDIGQGEHTLNAEWNSMKPGRSTHVGSAAVNIMGSAPMMITIVTHKVR